MKAFAKWSLRVGIWCWVAYWIAQIFIGDLGASPALTLNHKLGLITLSLLSANLVLGILLDFLRPAPGWIRFWVSERRFWGVSGFLILCVHVFFYFVNEAFEAKAFVQLYTKTYLIFASLAFLIMFALALTSNNFSVRKLGGKNWKRLHRTVYLAQWLVAGHVFLIEKADLVFYGIWLGLLMAAQALRLLRHGWKKLFGSKRVSTTT